VHALFYLNDVLKHFQIHNKNKSWVHLMMHQ